MIAKAASGNDQVFRIGGEEFAVLCPFPHPVARLLGENIRQSVAASRTDAVGGLSVSIGAATLSAGMPSLSELFVTADARLYAAKTSGRDRVVGDEAPDLRARDGTGGGA
jgi:diguanylate cyclase (GGDEF)-like protein